MAKKVKVINEVTVSDTDIKCPGCGATIKFDPSTSNLVCPFCGTTKEIPQLEDGTVIEEPDRLRKLRRSDSLRRFSDIGMLSFLWFDERYAGS